MAHEIGSLLLLGASGDLSGRLLLPAFGQLLDREESRQDVVLIGAGVEDLDSDAWQERVRSSFASGGGLRPNVEKRSRHDALSAGRCHECARTLQSLIDSCPVAPALYFCTAPIGDRCGLHGTSAGIAASRHNARAGEAVRN